ncbi:MAG: bifunctional glutamate N-acetyltransferase/amino-acid acetyltransferase ArgJ [bacterium]|nr:bifunctional glutamate N-acetyltransferase/amino-acid acetyltransferase ArgJ [bacterium]
MTQTTFSDVKGFKVAGVHAGLKADGALDMALIYSEAPCSAAGVFTTNLVKAAPVLVDQATLAANDHHIRAVIVNTRCANAATGQQGIDNARQMQRWTAERLGIGEDEVLVMSTGVIGTQLPMDKIQHGIALAVDGLGSDWDAAARGIMTTDTRPKLASMRKSANGYAVTGIAKGAGMIAPNMATMLGVITTDAAVQPDVLADKARLMANLTFNRISVDGDMSTNDTLLILANGQSGSQHEAGYFSNPLYNVCLNLAKAIVRDGEGATKFITINVRGTPTPEAAKQIAQTIATSPLVKTAFYGGDANWGRIMAAAGRAGIPFDVNQAELWICSGEETSAAPIETTNDWEAPYIKVPADALQLFGGGMPLAYDETAAGAIMQSRSITVTLKCGEPNMVSETVWTCDLSHDYVSVNGHYRS